MAGAFDLGGGTTGARTLAGTGTLALTGGSTAFGAGAVLSIAGLGLLLWAIIEAPASGWGRRLPC